MSAIEIAAASGYPGAMAASRTAQYVALYRALETYERRRPPLFRDSYETTTGGDTSETLRWPATHSTGSRSPTSPTGAARDQDLAFTTDWMAVE